MKKLLVGLLCLMMCLTAAVSLAQDVQLTGDAYIDENANAALDAGETLLSGVPVRLERNADDGWETVAEAVTDAYGHYAFAVPAPGTYRLLCPLNDPSFYAASIGASGARENGALCSGPFAMGDADATADIGLRPAATLKATAYLDGSANGTREKNEKGIPGITVELLDESASVVWASGITDKNGAVVLSAAPGTYVLRASLPLGYAFGPLGPNSCATSETGIAQSEPFRLAEEEPGAMEIALRYAGSFSGKAFEDMNNNGIMDDDEPGVAGVTVRMVGEKTKVVRTFTTDETGEYVFDRLPNDQYIVTATLPDGMLYARYSRDGGDLRSIFSGDVLERKFSVRSSAPLESKNIGTVQKGAITGIAFYDLNYNGVMDEGEPGYAGVTLEAIKLSNSESMGKCVTDAQGAYRIENLRGGEYRLRAVLPDDGSIFTVLADGTPEQANCFEQRTGRRENSIQPLVIASGGEAAALVGVARTASISGVVFQDDDYNGRRTGKEKALAGVEVRLLDASGSVIATAKTDNKGQYTLSGFMPGSYTLQVQRRKDFGFTRLRPSEKDGSYIAVLEGDWGRSDPIEVEMGQQLTAVNAGMLPSATVSGSLFHDLNDNGLWDDGEGGMVSATVTLVSADGEINLSRTPAEDGSFFFDGVMPGKYTLSYELPAYCEMAKVVKGGNTVKHQSGGASVSIKVAMGDAATLPLAGGVTLGTFIGTAFDDANANGVQDAGEPALAGVRVRLTASGSSPAEAVSAADGSFSLADLRPADYTLEMSLPDGAIFSHDLEALALPNDSGCSLSCPWDMLVNREAKALGAVRPAEITGQIWMDENQDGIQGQSEWIMEGVELSLVDLATDAVVASVVSDAEGFRFANVRPGRYAIRFPLPAQSTPADDASSGFQLAGSVMRTREPITLTEGARSASLRTGLVSRTSIGGHALLDEGGQRSPVEGLTVTLLKDGTAIASTATDAQGAYRFDGLWPAEYTLCATLPQGMIFVRPDDPDYAPGSTSIGDADAGRSDPFALQMAQHQLERNLLFIKPAKIGDLCWLDENENGLLDGTEQRLCGVRVSLVQNGVSIYETVTDASGYYLFSHVYPGEYTLRAQAWPALKPTQSVPGLRIISSCLTSGDGSLASGDSFRVLSGETNLNLDLGYCLIEGETLPPEAVGAPATRDWTLPNRQERVIY